MASGCFDDNREKVCRSCDSSFYRKVNACCENTFYRIGVLTAIYAPAIFVFFIVFFGGLGLGIYEANFQNDLYYLWIERGSRLLGERAFTAEHHSGGTTRAAFQVYTSKDESSNALTRQNLPFIYDTVYGALQTNATDDDLGTIGWHDVCDRIPTPPDLYGFMRLTGAKGFPCNKFAPTDCFAEGEYGSYGFDLPDAILSATASARAAGVGCCKGPIKVLFSKNPANPSQNFSTTDIIACTNICSATKSCVGFDYYNHGCTFYTAIPAVSFSTASIQADPTLCTVGNGSLTQCFAKQASFMNKYLFQKSYKNLTDAEILSIAGTPRACGNWIGAQPPENFLFGGMVRDAQKTVIKTPSIEMIVQIRSVAQYAKAKCVDACVNKAGCPGKIQLAFADLGSTTLPGRPGSCQAAVVNASVNCFQGPCTTNDTYAMGLVGVNASTLAAQYNNNCVVPRCVVGSSCNKTLDPLCGSCGANQSSPLCAACAQVCISQVPLLAACVQLCATPAAGACVGLALYNAKVCEVNCHKTCVSPDDESLDVAERAITTWEANYIKYMEGVIANKSNPYITDYFTERSIGDLVEAAGAADSILIVVGYIAMIAFGCATLVQYDTIQSRLMLGLVGMLMVIISIVAAMGFTAIVGIPYIPTIVQVLPFLALGLGTYDMFVLAFAFSYIPEKTIPAMIGELMKECGPRLLLTAATNIIVFGIGANVPLRAVNLFSGAMCIVIFFNFMILVFGFGALIALNAERMRKNKVDCFCCFNARYKSQSISTERSHQIGRFPLAFAKFMFWKPTQLFVFASSVVIFGVAMWGATKVEIGLPLEDIVPKDFYAYGFLKVRGEFYDAGSSYVITGYRGGVTQQIDHSDPVFLADMIKLEAKLQVLKGTDPTFPIWSVSWVDTFLYYCSITPGCAKPIDPKDPVVNVTGLNTATGRPVTNSTDKKAFYPYKNNFSASLVAYLGSSGLNSVQYLELDENNTIISSRIPYFQTGLSNDQQVVDYILATRAVTDACPQLVYPSGNYYDLYEQYVHTQQYLSTSLGYTCIGVLLITSLFLFHPGAVLIMFAVICLTLAEIYGFLAFFNLKINGVSVVNLIMAIGVIVAPVAHITRVFMVSQGTNAARAEHALAMMTFPMLFSTVSTFVGEFPLEFARFPYFRLYFFYQYVIIGVITLVNAFLPLPLLLSYLGPPPLTEENNAVEKHPGGYEKGGLVEIPGLEDSNVVGRTDGSSSASVL